ncbi:MAG TPA: BadF/BadG/BcrA/BcrD ATPase family protein [Terriglobales bacterium]|nr:BadF/BadG/BcrA/BcrD ATPase family protein [Terriglobales bacterium]
MPRPSDGDDAVLLLLDAGATHTRALVATAAGRVLGRGEAGAGNRLAAGGQAGAHWEAAARQALRAARVPGLRLAAWVAGVAGIGYDGAGGAAVARVLRRLAPRARGRVEPDARLALVGALGARARENRPCVVVISGTGSIVLGQGAGPFWTRAGGWGWLLGDEGSGQWLGRQAIAAAARAFDGSGPPTALAAVVKRGLRLPSFAALADAVYRPLLTPAQFGALAPAVLRVAARGDAVAAAIVRRGMAALAGQAVAVIARLRRREPDLGSPAWVAPQGAIFRAGDTVLVPLRDELARQAEEAGAGAVELVAPELPPLGGAFLLALRALGREPSPPVLARLRRALARGEGAARQGSR